MTHEYYAVIDGITLPGEGAVITGRVMNWLQKRHEYKIAPESCWVLKPKTELLPSKKAWEILADFFVELGTKLAESAGVNIIVDDVQFLLDQFPLDDLESPVWNLVYISTDSLTYTPVSEVVKIGDSMRMSSEESRIKFPDHISIFNSWKVLMQKLQNREECIFDLTAIREPDEKSSGRESFAEILEAIVTIFEKRTLVSFLNVCSKICSVIKRGGFRAHGAVTCSLKYDHPLILQYMGIPFNALSHIKKSVHWSVYEEEQNLFAHTQITYRKRRGIKYETIEKFIEKYNQGELFAEKNLGISQEKEIHSNVCRGIGLISEDKCLISNVNYGMLTALDDLPKLEKAYRETSEFLCAIFEKQESEGVVMADRQIAICPVGLANALRNLSITYREFIEALILFNEDSILIPKKETVTPAFQLVTAIFDGFMAAVSVGIRYGMRAVLSIEPNESCSRRYLDGIGYSLVPNIDPPDVVKGIGIEKRHSETGIFDFNGNRLSTEFNYGTSIEVATDITPEEHYTLWNEMQKLMDSTGHAHMASYEQWEPLNLATFLRWLYHSNLKTLYYFRLVGTQHLQKGNTISARKRLAEKQRLEELGNPECLACTDISLKEERVF